jgi:hypothetical protein
MANYVAILRKGMDVTPGGKSEAHVPAADRLGEAVDLERRVQLLVDTTSLVLFNYVAQVRGGGVLLAIGGRNGRLTGLKACALLRHPRHSHLTHAGPV